MATQPGQAAPVVRTLSFSQQAVPAPQPASISRIPTRVQRASSFHTGAPTPAMVYTAPGPAGRRTIHPAVPAATHGFVAPGFGRQTSTPVTQVPVTQPFGRQTSTPATLTQPFGRQTSTPATVSQAFGRQTSTPAPVPLQQAVPRSNLPSLHLVYSSTRRWPRSCRPSCHGHPDSTPDPEPGPTFSRRV